MPVVLLYKVVGRWYNSKRTVRIEEPLLEGLPIYHHGTAVVPHVKAARDGAAVARGGRAVAIAVREAGALLLGVVEVGAPVINVSVCGGRGFWVGRWGLWGCARQGAALAATLTGSRLRCRTFSSTMAPLA